MYIIVGLGNPGREYEKTRHNIGFLALDVLAQRHGIDISRHNHRSVFGEGRINGVRVVLAKPETYMNNSGWAVMDLMNWYKCDTSELIIIYDDIDIPTGTLRIRAGGSAGTHNGMRSIIYQITDDKFPRIRVGIGRPDGQRPLVNHVLSTPVGDEAALMNEALAKAADAAELIVAGKLNEAQAQFNLRSKKTREKAIKEQETQVIEETNNG